MNNSGKTAVAELNEFCQKNRFSVEFNEISQSFNSSTFHCSCTVGSLTVTGVGNSKKEAKHDAASKYLKIISEVSNQLLPTSETQDIKKYIIESVNEFQKNKSRFDHSHINDSNSIRDISDVNVGLLNYLKTHSSTTLDSLRNINMNDTYNVDFVNYFMKIIEELDLLYYYEEQPSNEDTKIVFIYINHNLLVSAGQNELLEYAICNACQMALKMICLFSNKS